ncbi:tetratricopeptide repeat protein, partial [Salmonella enterica]|uniref:tetratricopeptide repeat protein n=1 Tax=Salmonella enterica TaxID=28901 RepID=UPI003CFB2B50
MGDNYLVDLVDFSFNYARCLHEKQNDALAKTYYDKCIDLWTSMSGGGTRNLCLSFQEYGDILFSENKLQEAIEKYRNALKYNKEDWYIEVD